MTLSHIRQLTFCVLIGTGLAGLAACKEAVEPVAPPPLEVQVQKVEQEDVPIFFEWIGTTDGLVNAKIRAQVTGYLLKQQSEENTGRRSH